MAKKDEALVEFFAKVQAGRPVFPEDVRQAAKNAGLKQEEIDRKALVVQDVFEWEDAKASQAREPINVPEHLLLGENAAAEGLEKVQVTSKFQGGTGSNKPEENVRATGKADLDDDGNPVAVGTSGQVAP